jgi:hypothetical protein
MDEVAPCHEVKCCRNLDAEWNQLLDLELSVTAYERR